MGLCSDRRVQDGPAPTLSVQGSRPPSSHGGYPTCPGGCSGLLRGMLKKGYAYKKCGVGLLDLRRPENLQCDLFQSPVMGSKAVMDTLDAINRKFGRGAAGFARTGWKSGPAWEMRQKNTPLLHNQMGGGGIYRILFV